MGVGIGQGVGTGFGNIAQELQIINLMRRQRNVLNAILAFLRHKDSVAAVDLILKRSQKAIRARLLFALLAAVKLLRTLISVQNVEEK